MERPVRSGVLQSLIKRNTSLNLRHWAVNGKKKKIRANEAGHRDKGMDVQKLKGKLETPDLRDGPPSVSRV